VSAVRYFVSLFAIGVIDAGSKFAAGIVDTICKFATGINNTPELLIPVSLLVHLNLRISPQIFKIMEMTLILFSGAWGKMIHEKKLKQKSCDMHL
jgi:hypothetical protein